MTRKNNNAVIQFKPRIDMPADIKAEFDLSGGQWRVLIDQCFPNVTNPASIALALDYCKVRGLDIYKKPIHIVPMKNRDEKWVDTVWPGINEILTTATRSNKWAGYTPVKFGKESEQKFECTDDQNRKLEHIMSVPLTCELTVFSLVQGHKAEFPVQLRWLETYARWRGSMPTAMWKRRPAAQLEKCTLAAGLRRAFPEEAGFTAEEMHGQSLDAASKLTDVTVVGETDIEIVSSNANGYSLEALCQRSPTDPVFSQISNDARNDATIGLEWVVNHSAWEDAFKIFRDRFHDDLEFAYAMSRVNEAKKARQIAS